MFDGAGAESLCTKPNASPGYAIQGGEGAKLTPGARIAPRNIKTPNGPAIAFPMVDPYSPANRAMIPVPGYNVWPGRANRLGKRYYGLSGGFEGVNTRRRRKSFAGMGSFFYEGKAGGPIVLTSPTIGQPNTSGTSIWDKIFGTIERTLPASISAIKGQGVPYGYYNPQTGGYSQTPQMGYQQAPKGYSYNSSGQLVKDAVGSVTDFVGNNPLLVGGGILAVALLFMRPPSGRR